MTFLCQQQSISWGSYNIPKLYHQRRTECLNTGDQKGHFSFKPEPWGISSLLCELKFLKSIINCTNLYARLINRLELQWPRRVWNVEGTETNYTSSWAISSHIKSHPLSILFLTGHPCDSQVKPCVMYPRCRLLGSPSKRLSLISDRILDLYQQFSCFAITYPYIMFPPMYFKDVFISDLLCFVAKKLHHLVTMFKQGVPGNLSLHLQAMITHL